MEKNMLNPSQDLGAHTKSYDANASANSGAPVLITAAGTGDNVKITGVTIDRYTANAMADSCVVQTGWLAALTAAKTLSLAHELQESADGSSWDTAEVIQAATVVGTGAGNIRGVSVHDINLRGRKRYIRFNVTPDLSHTSTDTCTFHTVATLGGYDTIPQAS
jgi:hypothetical protein